MPKLSPLGTGASLGAIHTIGGKGRTYSVFYQNHQIRKALGRLEPLFILYSSKQAKMQMCSLVTRSGYSQEASTRQVQESRRWFCEMETGNGEHWRGGPGQSTQTEVKSSWLSRADTICWDLFGIQSFFLQWLITKPEKDNDKKVVTVEEHGFS